MLGYSFRRCKRTPSSLRTQTHFFPPRRDILKSPIISSPGKKNAGQTIFNFFAIFFAEKSTIVHLFKNAWSLILYLPKETLHTSKNPTSKTGLGKPCQIESDPTNRSPSRGNLFVASHPIQTGSLSTVSQDTSSLNRGTDNTPVTPDERSAQINVSIDPRRPRGNKKNLKLTARAHENIENFTKKESSFPTIIFRGLCQTSGSYKSLWMCRGVGKERVHIRDPLKVASL